jgi:hypothetical protein
MELESLVVMNLGRHDLDLVIVQTNETLTLPSLRRSNYEVTRTIAYYSYIFDQL